MTRRKKEKKRNAKAAAGGFELDLGTIGLAGGSLGLDRRRYTRRICSFLLNVIATHSGCPLDHCSVLISLSAL